MRYFTFFAYCIYSKKFILRSKLRSRAGVHTHQFNIYLVRAESGAGAGERDVDKILLVAQAPERRHHRRMEVVPAQRVLLLAGRTPAACRQTKQLYLYRLGVLAVVANHRTTFVRVHNITRGELFLFYLWTLATAARVRMVFYTSVSPEWKISHDQKLVNFETTDGQW
ncbi:hypothetical protein EVAR_38801_1 [Eumeta japonica]|uniref:Uncharacterized protein n=1 Tax=Eumeta variegata TaxID=151549 RepID=A0A4C1WMQ9_EUMVA|nr:hypothetical protein EVAR_38801_1 [Eumeta japonica]